MVRHTTIFGVYGVRVYAVGPNTVGVNGVGVFFAAGYREITLTPLTVHGMRHDVQRAVRKYRTLKSIIGGRDGLARKLSQLSLMCL